MTRLHVPRLGTGVRPTASHESTSFRRALVSAEAKRVRGGEISVDCIFGDDARQALTRDVTAFERERGQTREGSSELADRG